ncbi:MAG: hypothetical protein JOZ14_16820 [Acidobacteria bacterium]|nr:hypothetical protein [Acidobacteriota bacterium]
MQVKKGRRESHGENIPKPLLTASRDYDSLAQFSDKIRALPETISREWLWRNDNVQPKRWIVCRVGKCCGVAAAQHHPPYLRNVGIDVFSERAAKSVARAATRSERHG